MPLILHADDELSERWDFKYLINGLEPSVEVFECNDGLEVMQQLGNMKDEQLPKLIFLDLRMPVWDGIRTLKALKAEARYVSIPVYMWSETDSKNEISLCLQLGAEKFLVKPTTEEDRLETRIVLAELLTKITLK